MPPAQFEVSASMSIDRCANQCGSFATSPNARNSEQDTVMFGRQLISRPNIDHGIRLLDLDSNLKDQTERDTLVETLVTKIGFGLVPSILRGPPGPIKTSQRTGRCGHPAP